MAIADGLLIDASKDQLGFVSTEHFPGIHLAMTADVFALVDAAVKENPGFSYTGIWHNILWMSRTSRTKILGDGHLFRAGIRSKHSIIWQELKILFHTGDQMESCATVMLPSEE